MGWPAGGKGWRVVAPAPGVLLGRQMLPMPAGVRPWPTCGVTTVLWSRPQHSTESGSAAEEEWTVTSEQDMFGNGKGFLLVEEHLERGYRVR